MDDIIRNLRKRHYLTLTAYRMAGNNRNVKRSKNSGIRFKTRFKTILYSVQTLRNKGLHLVQHPAC